MTSRKVLVDVLRATGVQDDEATQFAAITPPAGVSWTSEVLNSGKVDETKFAAELARHFNSPSESVDAAKVDRAVLQLLPSRFVFKHHVLPLSQTETGVKLATYDVFNQVARRLAAQQLTGKRIEWASAPRGQRRRAIKTGYGVGAETVEERLSSTATDDGSLDSE